MKIEGKIIVPHVYLLKFETQYELCMSFVRMQEFYESPKFRGKYFTLEKYIDYWSKEFGHGSFTYPSVWNGFNIPGKVLYDWINKFYFGHGNIRDREENILHKICGLMGKEIGFTLMDSEDMENIYVIGIHGKNNERTIQHELAHAMYYLNEDYRKSCKTLLRKMDKKAYETGKKWLLDKGYCNKMIDDELQAYFSTGGISVQADFQNNFSVFKKQIEKTEQEK